MDLNMGNTWTLVLAAGEGSRLRSVTTTREGESVPKQFCSLHGGLSLLHEAMRRAESISAREQVCTVVAAEHRHWWDKSLQSLPRSNIIVQPRNRGTANGILLPLLHILDRDPDARVVLLPSDHHVSDEGVLARVLRTAVDQLKRCQREIILLGISPDEPDAELGYIVPTGLDSHGLARVAQFVEKPPLQRAVELIRQGALWNAFIVVARGQALLDLFLQRRPDIVADLQAAVAHDCVDPQRPVAAAYAYERLPDLDFSKHIVQDYEGALRVVAVPHCGWSDLGTPKRVAETLRRAPRPLNDLSDITFPLRGHLNLAERFLAL